MISQEQFTKIELEHGCGYWNLCWEHACPCAITTEHKGLRQDIWDSMVEENKKIVEEYDREYNNGHWDDSRDEEDHGDYFDTPEMEYICEECGNEIDIITAARYGDKCYDCKFGIK